ncbi:MAG: T9SS type A sorting domain-containing protein [Crocinitomicaceae bacterium]
MFKKITLSFVLFVSFIASAQNIPTLVSYTIVDTMCFNSYNKHFLNVTIEDLDGDSTYIDLLNSSNGYLDDGYYTIIEPAYLPGSNTRTFKIHGNSAYTAPTGLNMENLNFDIIGNVTNDGGAGFDNVNNIPIYGDIIADLDLSGITFCSTDNPVDISQYANPSGGTFSWGVSEVITTDGIFDPENYASEANDGINYEYVNSAGCIGYDLEVPNIFISPTASMSASPSTCGSADGSAYVNISGNSPPFEVYWTTGFTESNVSVSSSVSNLSSGVYYANIYDVSGCHVQSTAQIIDSDITITPTITDPTCPGSLDGSIDLSIGTSGNVDEVFWSNGMSGSSISGLGAGEYTVMIHTDNNCKAYATYQIASLNQLGVTVNNIGYVDCGLANPLINSEIDITTTGGSGSYMWNWNSGQTTEDLTSVPVGWYKCSITDAVTGCTWSWGTEINDFSGPYAYVEEIIPPDCNESNGMIDISVYPATSGAQIVSTLWNTGAATEDMINAHADSYSVIIEDADGCQATVAVDLSDRRPYQPTICLLTVDTSFVYNQVVWEKDVTQDIAGFNVYRETQTMGDFELVAQRPYSLESTFMDNAASPIDRSWRYYITTYDACGNESYPSFIHKTIHTVSTTSNGTDYTVHWDNYEGISYTSVDVYRHDNTNGWTLVGPGQTTNSFPDVPPVTAGLDYMVSFNLTDPCTSTKATDYNSSRSNTTSAVFDPGNSTVSIVTEESGRITTYPNPVNDHLTIFIEQWEQFETVTIRDVQGKVILTKVISDANTEVSMGEFSNGIYFITLSGENHTFNQKVIKK